MADTTSAAPGEPVAGQCRFVGAQWSECATEHVAMVLANPAEWEGYEVRYLYAAPQPVAREPLSDEQIVAIWMEKPRYHAAPIGVTDIEFARSIERAHGITNPPRLPSVVRGCDDPWKPK